jgi:casein kinase 1
MLARIQNEQNHADRRRDRDERRRSGMVPPSPALVRHGSKHGVKLPAALTPGQLTPHSTQAQLNISIGNNQRSAGVTHPYAAVGIGVGHEYNQNHEQFKHSPLMQQTTATIWSTITYGAQLRRSTPAMHSVHVENQGGIGQDYQQSRSSTETISPSHPYLQMLTCCCKTR